MRRTLAILAIILLCVQANADETQRTALRNLRGVVYRVTVEKANANLSQIVSQDEFQRAGEKQLRATGLYVGTQEQIKQRPSPPVLLVAINGGVYQGALAFTVNVNLIDEVEAERPAAVISASTWSANFFGMCPTEDLKILKQTVKNALDEFIEDWQSANPRR